MLCKESYHIICLIGTAQEYLFHSYSLFILKENSLSKGETLDNNCICIFRDAKSGNCVELK